MHEPLQLDPRDFFDFITRPTPVVLFISPHPAYPFNGLLCDYFDQAEGSRIAFAHVKLLDLLNSAGPALAYLHGEILACGTRMPLAVPPGYYLFQQGRMLAWDSGLPEAGDTKRIIRRSLLGAAFTLLTRNFGFVTRALRTAAEEAAAVRVALHFQRAAAAHRENPRKASAHTRTTTDELASAYRVLQVEPTASDEEVNQSWRRLQQRFHPDRAGDDPSEHERLSRRSAEINRARDIIRNHRRKTGGRAATA
ncbi:MAG: J domain-containing protein [Chromatiales bacterium]|jgi:hypothetical protein